MANVYLIKLGRKGVPREIVMPKSSTDWLGEFSCQTGGKAVGIGEGDLPFPQDGDAAYVWVHEKHGGSGLTATGRLKDVTNDNGDLRFSLEKIILQKPTLGLRENGLDAPIFQALDAARHDKAWYLSPQDLADIEDAVGKKVALINSYTPSIDTATGARPEDVFDVRSALQSEGFRIVNDHRNKVDELYSEELDCVAYVLKERNNNKVAQPHTLAFHPLLHKSLTKSLSHPGVRVYDQLLHHSNFNRFEKDPPQTYCGTQVSVTSSAGMRHLVEALREIFIGPVDGRSLAASEAGSSEFDEGGGTERQTITMARIGQGQFRSDLIDYWQACAVTGMANKKLLRASHIKPWSDSDNRERLDPFNGLLLSPNLDLAFDQYFISFDDDGVILLSASLSKSDIVALGISNTMRLSNVDPEHLKYLRAHRKQFKLKEKERST